MMAAGRAAELGAKVALVEKNQSLGKKLIITGGGRCNILHAEFDTHLLVEKYGKKGKSLFSAFSQLDAQAAWDFFESRGLKLKIEAEHRAFPKSENAEDVRRVLMEYMSEHGVEILSNTQILALESDGSVITNIIHDSGLIVGKNYVVATGGKSHPETGSTGDGFLWMSKLGHTVIESDPALVPIAIKNRWVKRASGISLKNVRLTILQGGARHESAIGKMLFTHVGVSGPLVLNMSKRVGELLKDGDVALSIDLFPKTDHAALDDLLLQQFEKGKNKLLKNNIGDVVQPRLAQELLIQANIDPATPLYRLTRDDRKAFVQILKNVPLAVKGLLGTDKAVVTGGGVTLKEIEFKTMRSKLYENLYLAGDILDFDRPSGGFSLQICWTTGYIAGANAAKSHVQNVR